MEMLFHVQCSRVRNSAMQFSIFAMKNQFALQKYLKIAMQFASLVLRLISTCNYIQVLKTIKPKYLIHSWFIA